MLNYRTFSELMAAVKEDLQLYEENNLIKDYRYIKTARACNALLGAKIAKFNRAVLEVEEYKAELPHDFYRLHTAYAIYDVPLGYTKYQPGTTTRVYSREEVINKPIKGLTGFGCKDDKNGCYVITRNFNSEQVITEALKPLVIAESAYDRVLPGSPNLRLSSDKFSRIDFVNNELLTDFEKGHVLIEYMCDLISEEGELLVLSHPLVDNFYEAAIKEKILTDLAYNKQADVVNLLKDAREQVSIERNRAVSIRNTETMRRMDQYTKERQQELYDKQFKHFFPNTRYV